MDFPITEALQVLDFRLAYAGVVLLIFLGDALDTDLQCLGPGIPDVEEKGLAEQGIHAGFIYLREA